ncbi:MAG: acetate-CoA ligase (ADP-forming) subunit beta [Candidatus Brocadia sinica]|nr:MAG: acetate-CoA ligase (ADP-forming) subunit beta [Candidatus Brocadia sinica]
MNKFMTHSGKIARHIIQKVLLQNRYELLEPEAKEFIEAFGISTTRYVVTVSPADAIQAAKSVGYPVVLKIVSPDISHKTDVGGVKLGIKDDEGVKVAYDEIIRNVKKRQPDARIDGILVQEMATPSTEVIVGGLRDPQFGPAVMFGLGGIFVEVFKDVSFRIAPVDEYEALDMIHGIKGAKILKGFRNAEAADIPALAQIIVQVSDIMISLEEIKEIDLNPVLVYPKGLKAVDARIILRQL